MPMVVVGSKHHKSPHQKQYWKKISDYPGQNHLLAKRRGVEEAGPSFGNAAGGGGNGKPTTKWHLCC